MMTRPAAAAGQPQRQVTSHFWRLLPFGIAIAVLVIAFTLERLFVQQQQHHLQRTIEARTVAVKNEIQSHLSNYLLSLVRIRFKGSEPLKHLFMPQT
ncbi:MAG: hypothetical protein OQK94_09215 [Gammaproteobacteria bacterium]|nr:hypothetical protein [Gammaproteobacteria bacterium]MCW8840852.1 hypothetical protein [Gammaproteobacteria bacterium]MCW8957862.1 hypothetical protein [Gammaproteobacteria bacterium]MCW8972170.1 hypothetical protein [Gammaproteobacteria bacterium]MCW8991820.1 hypothetical protein [Gammaproteobacteria bacterium]